MIHQKISYVETRAFPSCESSKLLILDRDGVINEDSHGYFYDKNNIIYIKKNLRLIKEYVYHGWVLCVATNQSGIGRGIYSQKIFIDLCETMFRDLLKENIVIHRWYFCPHNPEIETCNCRKPSPAMLLKAINDFKPTEAIFIGDKSSDRDAAENAGIKFIKV